MYLVAAWSVDRFPSGLHCLRSKPGGDVPLEVTFESLSLDLCHYAPVAFSCVSDMHSQCIWLRPGVWSVFLAVSIACEVSLGAIFLGLGLLDEDMLDEVSLDLMFLELSLLDGDSLDEVSLESTMSSLSPSSPGSLIEGAEDRGEELIEPAIR